MSYVHWIQRKFEITDDSALTALKNVRDDACCYPAQIVGCNAGT